ncbi:hypothetical protein LG288_10075 [Idiomarina seosinensis]|uniref:bacteriorhodopsin n=1 Tax=Idiomarina seosinensis TaxID=281739 RepID=UPI00384C425E
MENYENFMSFGYWQYEVIRHAFGFTVAVFAASLVYFAMTVGQATAKYRMTFAISAVVMVSATFEIFQLWNMWDKAFIWDETQRLMVRAEGEVFSNGYRYANWLIDVPMLLTQFLIVLQFTGRDLFSRWWKLTTAGAVMIILGYIGQYYEPQVADLVDGSAAPFWIWGGLSWLVFFVLLGMANNAVKAGLPQLHEESRGAMRNAWKLLVITWFIYGFAYMVPAVPGAADNDTLVVIRQLMFTFSDVVSKTVFGVLLANVALIQSRHDTE